jgi:TRAP-type C4-dicarboxylate transport system permease large subunit
MPARVRSRDQGFGSKTARVGLGIFVIKNVAPQRALIHAIRGGAPRAALMFVAVFLLCAFPGIATSLPNMVMGAK